MARPRLALTLPMPQFALAEMFTSGEVRFAVDIYSLGIVIYWLVAGRGPYVGLPPFQVRCTAPACTVGRRCRLPWCAQGAVAIQACMGSMHGWVQPPISHPHWQHVLDGVGRAPALTWVVT